MNQKQIEQQIEKLNKKREQAVAKKDEMLKKCQAEIAEIDAQINSFKKVLESLNRLAKQQQEQMEAASKLLKGNQ